MLIARNFTIEPIEPLFQVAAFRAGFDAQLAYSSYEPFADEQLDAQLSEDPSVVFLAIRLEELAPALMKDFLGLERADAVALADASVDQVVALCRRIRGSSPAPILVHNFVTPLSTAAGLADAQDSRGQINLVRRMNVDLAEALTSVAGAHVLDVDHVFVRFGLERCYDERGARLSGAPLSHDALRALAESQVRHIQALKGARVKCIVVDCDNTLWGGVVGEDGIANIVMGPTGSGRPHHDLQRSLRDLKRRGVVLAICSKNEEKDVLDVLRNHPDSLLHEDDFAAMRINWDDKATNIESLAKELNLGLEHILFIDDSAVEAGWIKDRLPAIRVLQWSADASEVPLSAMAEFDSLVLTEEDQKRTELYRSEAKRREASQGASSIEDYLRSLNLVATIGTARPEQLPRLAQLTQRTNQFNLTTRRYDVSTLEDLMRDPASKVVWLELQDRFGSSGLVGCGILRVEKGAARIDTLLLSCRVIGRGAEGVLVNRMAGLAVELGAHELHGEYIPSERNGQVAELYGRLGFTKQGADGGAAWWTWVLSQGLPTAPDWISVIDRIGG